MWNTYLLEHIQNKIKNLLNEKTNKIYLKFFPYDISVKIIHFVKLIIDKEYRWLSNTYWKFGQEKKKNIFECC